MVAGIFNIFFILKWTAIGIGLYFIYKWSKPYVMKAYYWIKDKIKSFKK